MTNNGQITYHAMFTEMELKLSHLASVWRGTQDPDVAHQYQTIMNCLLDLGWDLYLEPDAELPIEMTPERYFHRHEQVTSGE